LWLVGEVGGVAAGEAWDWVLSGGGGSVYKPIYAEYSGVLDYERERGKKPFRGGGHAAMVMETGEDQGPTSPLGPDQRAK
jgi:hypothetical protein